MCQALFSALDIWQETKQRPACPQEVYDLGGGEWADKIDKYLSAEGEGDFRLREQQV